jgi:predicted HTH transcriptional regulator
LQGLFWPVGQKLNDRQKKGLEYAKEKRQITTREYRRLCNISERQAFDDLKSLLEMGILIRTGSGRTTSYVPTSSQELRDSCGINAQLVRD